MKKHICILCAVILCTGVLFVVMPSRVVNQLPELFYETSQALSCCWDLSATDRPRRLRQFTAGLPDSVRHGGTGGGGGGGGGGATAGLATGVQG